MFPVINAYVILMFWYRTSGCQKIFYTLILWIHTEHTTANIFQAWLQVAKLQTPCSNPLDMSLKNIQKDLIELRTHEDNCVTPNDGTDKSFISEKRLSSLIYKDNIEH